MVPIGCFIHMKNHLVKEMWLCKAENNIGKRFFIELVFQPTDLFEDEQQLESDELII